MSPSSRNLWLFVFFRRAEDEAHRERIQAKNTLENFTYSVKNTIDKPEIKDKISEEDKKKLEDAASGINLCVARDSTVRPPPLHHHHHPLPELPMRYIRFGWKLREPSARVLFCDVFFLLIAPTCLSRLLETISWLDNNEHATVRHSVLFLFWRLYIRLAVLTR